MKESQISESRNTDMEVSLKSRGATRNRKKEIVGIRARSPTTASCEIPILLVLSRDPIQGTRALTVVREVSSSIWFPKLTGDDREARYIHSHKKIVSSVVRWCRENLVLRNEIFPPGYECRAGTWRSTPKGLARAKENATQWTPRYTLHDAVIIRWQEKTHVDYPE